MVGAMLSYAEQPRYASHLALIAPPRAIALLCVIRKRKLSFAAHLPHLPAAAARLVTNEHQAATRSPRHAAETGDTNKQAYDINPLLQHDRDRQSD